MPEGVFNSNLLLVETERQMMACAQEVIIVADHTKFGRQSLSWLCGLQEIDRLVVDPALPDAYRVHFEAADVTIHLAAIPGCDPSDFPNGSPRTISSRAEP
jgi:DeoR family fructose operon transcriptional repressor